MDEVHLLITAASYQTKFRDMRLLRDICTPFVFLTATLPNHYGHHPLGQHLGAQAHLGSVQPSWHSLGMPRSGQYLGSTSRCMCMSHGLTLYSKLVELGKVSSNM